MWGEGMRWIIALRLRELKFHAGSSPGCSWEVSTSWLFRTESERSTKRVGSDMAHLPMSEARSHKSQRKLRCCDRSWCAFRYGHLGMLCIRQTFFRNVSETLKCFAACESGRWKLSTRSYFDIGSMVGGMFDQLLITRCAIHPMAATCAECLSNKRNSSVKYFARSSWNLLILEEMK